VRYRLDVRGGETVTDVLIRNVPEEDPARLPLTLAALQRFSELAADLLDEEVMRKAWS